MSVLSAVPLRVWVVLISPKIAPYFVVMSRRLHLEYGISRYDQLDGDEANTQRDERP